mgnify:CR=1 FL=1
MSFNNTVPRFEHTRMSSSTAASTTPDKAKTGSQPNSKTLGDAWNLSVQFDKPVMSDYWEESVTGVVFFGIKPEKEKILVKSVDEYTSPIEKIYRSGDDYIVMTENSIYIVKATIQKKNIQV